MLQGSAVEARLGRLVGTTSRWAVDMGTPFGVFRARVRATNGELSRDAERRPTGGGRRIAAFCAAR